MNEISKYCPKKTFISFLSETIFNKTIKIIVCIGNGINYVIVGRMKQIFADLKLKTPHNLWTKFWKF